jgi:phosphoribosylformimino-5-aminoimidazole carboxamide ribotide isomerase
MRIIPAIDIIDGKCVRLTQGDYSRKKIYAEDPLEVAKKFEDHGIKYLHLVDLDGARSHQIKNHEILLKIATGTNLTIDFGGGIKQESDLKIAFENGASQVTVGSTAAENPDLFLKWLENYGKSKIILGADAKQLKVSINGWQEDLKIGILDFIESYVQHGIEYVVCTDISKDGMLQGPATELYKLILQKNDIKLVASGGISTLSELNQMAAIGCDGAIIGKAIYEHKITLKEISQLC